MVVSSGRSFETVSIVCSMRGPANRRMGAVYSCRRATAIGQRRHGSRVAAVTPLVPAAESPGSSSRSFGRVVSVSIACREHVAGKVGTTEAAARKLGIGKPIELLVQGCSLVIIGASPEPSRNPHTQAPVPAVPGGCTPDDERALRRKRLICGHRVTHGCQVLRAGPISALRGLEPR